VTAFDSVLETLPPFDLSDVPALRAAMAGARAREPLCDARVQIEEIVVPGRDGQPDVRVRTYAPLDQGRPVPAMLFLHAGGFVLGGLETDEARCVRYCAEAGYLIVAVEYRLAPEQPFPAAFDDCLAALCWMWANADRLGVDRHRMGVGGSSAGAALATGLALWARDNAGPTPAFQFLVYPVIDDRTRPSIKRFWDSAGWNGAATDAMWSHYLQTPEASSAPYAVPGRAESLVGLPRTYVVVAGADPLRDEGLEYAARLQAAGVPTEIHDFPCVPHGFDLFAPDLPVSRRAVAEQVAVLLELASEPGA
jgi:acetyl esterase/lipase